VYKEDRTQQRHQQRPRHD